MHCDPSHHQPGCVVWRIHFKTSNSDCKWQSFFLNNQYVFCTGGYIFLLGFQKWTVDIPGVMCSRYQYCFRFLQGFNLYTLLLYWLTSKTSLMSILYGLITYVKHSHNIVRQQHWTISIILVIQKSKHGKICVIHSTNSSKVVEIYAICQQLRQLVSQYRNRLVLFNLQEAIIPPS